MKLLAYALLCLVTVTPALHGEEPKIDWDRAKILHERAQRGETLSSEDQVYYEEAKRQFPAHKQQIDRQQQQPANDGFDWQRAKEIHARQQKGEAITADEQKILDEALRRFQHRQQGQPSQPGAVRDFVPSEAAKGLVPLTELKDKYLEWDGGLYGGGSNEVPPAQQALATKALTAIRPLNVEGKPAEDGKIVLMSIGMSNTTMEFSQFVKAANADERKAINVLIVDGAQGGKAAKQWAASDAPPWAVAEQRLQAAGVTLQQVQVLWIKQANMAPSAGSVAEAKRLQSDMQTIVTLAKQKYPNLQLAFLSSRIYAGFAQTPLNPEPYAYEGAFAMRGLILQQMKGDPVLSLTKSPVLLWGPYLWGAGSHPRKGDGLVWKPEDFGGDGTHPSILGAQKVSRLLLDFFTSDANAKGWFVKK